MTNTALENKIIVLLIVETTIPPVSRANRRLYHLAVKLMENDRFHVHMIAPSVWPWTRKSAFIDRIIMNQYWGFNFLLYSPIRVIVRLWHFFATILSVIYLSRYFQQRHNNSISVVHAWNPLAGIAAYFGSILIGSKFYLDLTDLYSDIARTDMPLFKKMLNIIERWIVQKADRIFVVSSHMKTYLGKEFKAAVDKIHVVSDGVDLDTFDYRIIGTDIFTQHGLKDDNFILIFHGDAKHDDGVDILFKAFIAAFKKNQKIRLIILGGGGPYFAKLWKKFAPKMPTHAVIYPGWVSNESVPKYLSIANVGVMPSRASLNHNLYVSFKLFEYWSMRKPVIVSKLKAISEFFVHKKTGLMISENNPKTLEKAILYMASHREEAKKMGVLGRKLVERKYRWDTLMKKEVDVYVKNLHGK